MYILSVYESKVSSPFTPGMNENVLFSLSLPKMINTRKHSTRANLCLGRDIIYY